MLVTDHPFHTLLFLFDQISSQADQFLKVSKYLGLCNKMDFAPKQRKSRQDDKHNKFVMWSHEKLVIALYGKLLHM